MYASFEGNLVSTLREIDVSLLDSFYCYCREYKSDTCDSEWLNEFCCRIFTSRRDFDCIDHLSSLFCYEHRVHRFELLLHLRTDVMH